MTKRGDRAGAADARTRPAWNGHDQALLYWPQSDSVCAGGEKGAYSLFYDLVE